MIKQGIIILEFKKLYNILEEIREYLTFDLINYDDKQEFIAAKSSNKINLENFIILVGEENKNLLKSDDIDSRAVLVIDNLPLEINRIIELINVQFIKQRYNYQSQLNIKDYIVDFNSRNIKKNNHNLKLTEKEINIILFLYNLKKPQKIKALQKEVWGYNSKLETHTVETHIYRLRKKILENFKDELIMNNKKGYFI